MIDDETPGADGGVGGSNGSGGTSNTSPFIINTHSMADGPTENQINRNSNLGGYTTGVIQMNVQDKDFENITLRDKKLRQANEERKF